MDNNKAIAIKYDKAFHIVEANELIRSKQDDLTVLEAKLVRLAIAQVLQIDTDLKTYSCSITELADFLKMDRHNIYREMDTLTTNLLRKVIYIRKKTPGKNGKPAFKKFHWVDSAEYADGILMLKLSDDLKPYLLGLNEFFSSYEYAVPYYLPNNNSMRLFELLWSFVNITYKDRGQYKTPVYLNIPLEKNEFAFSIDYLRELLNCEDKYPNTGDFIKRIIDPCIKAIKENTTLSVSYRKVKHGRAIGFLVFRLNDPRDYDPSLERKLIAELEEERRAAE